DRPASVARPTGRATSSSAGLSRTGWPGRVVTSSALAVVCCQGGGEKVDEHLVDALSLVVMHPMGRIGHALYPVEVGHIVLVGLGEFGAEVAIALPPDDQRGRADGAKRRFGLLGRGSVRGPVVVDHRGGRAWLRPRLGVTVDLLRRVGRVGGAQE